MKDYIQKRDESAERRFISPIIEVRMDGDSQMIEGIAAVIDKETDLGWFSEKIERGAFDGVMGDDVVALFNHDPNFPLARSSAQGDGHLDLYITPTGDLGYRYKTPNTTIGKDLSENIRTGVVSKSSFAFTVEADEWQQRTGDQANDLRVIKKIKRLYDVSPVTYPAYNDTTVAARSLEKVTDPKKDLVIDKARRDKELREIELKTV